MKTKQHYIKRSNYFKLYEELTEQEKQIFHKNYNKAIGLNESAPVNPYSFIEAGYRINPITLNILTKQEDKIANKYFPFPDLPDIVYYKSIIDN